LKGKETSSVNVHGGKKSQSRGHSASGDFRKERSTRKWVTFLKPLVKDDG